MVIKDKNFIRGRGLVVTGEADPDEFHVNDQITIYDGENVVDTGIVAGIERTYLCIDPLKIDPNVGLVLKYTDYDLLKPGMILKK